MKSPVKILFSLLVFVFLCTTVPVQAQSDSTFQAEKSESITISSSGEAIVPADMAILSVTISVTNEDAEHAFDLHKERESFLANLLTDLELPDEKISYQPISIRPNRQRDGATHTSTSQNVTIELDNFDQLSEIQLKLISNEFDNFSGSLASTQMQEGAEEALKKAVENARADAEILAEASGKQLGDVLWIDHTSDGLYRPAKLSESVRLQTADYGPSLGDFSQTISIQKRIQIKFELLDESN